MHVDRRTFILTATAAAAACSTHGAGPLARAAQYLWAQQAADGGFHSRVYGLLRSGQSLTPFVLGALLRVPAAMLPAPPEAVTRAIAFIKAHTDSNGALGHAVDGVADYPNYATALAIHALATAGLTDWRDQVAPMVAQLRAQQFSEANGWTARQAPYGGWGMGGSIRHPPDAGHVDLSMTRVVLEALRDAGVPATDKTMTRAHVFLMRAQNDDGGFHFSPVTPALNKAGGRDGEPVSYGSTTADGVLALRAAGLPEHDTRIVRAVQWLERHHRPDRVPGFPDDEPLQTSWSTGLRFYYAAAIARALPHLPIDLPDQGGDGSFRNPNNRVKEDDPLIATTFAIHALLAGA